MLSTSPLNSSALPWTLSMLLQNLNVQEVSYIQNIFFSYTFSVFECWESFSTDREYNFFFVENDEKHAYFINLNSSTSS